MNYNVMTLEQIELSVAKARAEEIKRKNKNIQGRSYAVTERGNFGRYDEQRLIKRGWYSHGYVSKAEKLTTARVNTTQGVVIKRGAEKIFK